MCSTVTHRLKDETDLLNIFVLTVIRNVYHKESNLTIQDQYFLLFNLHLIKPILIVYLPGVNLMKKTNNNIRPVCEQERQPRNMK